MDNPKENSFNKLIPLAISTFQRIAASSATSSQPHSKDVLAAALPSHALCGRSGGPYRTIHAAMLRVFGFKEQPITQRWIEMLFSSILSCKDCYAEYMAARDDLRES
jgi:hypothetical protein